jgi:hypothetical protein
LEASSEDRVDDAKNAAERAAWEEEMTKSRYASRLVEAREALKRKEWEKAEDALLRAEQIMPLDSYAQKYLTMARAGMKKG